MLLKKNGVRMIRAGAVVHCESIIMVKSFERAMEKNNKQGKKRKKDER